MPDEHETRLGHAVDCNGEPVVDPTKNVRELVTQAILRQDDLRDAQGKYLLSELQGLRGSIDARFGGVDEQFRATESRRVEQKLDTKTAVDAALLAAKEAVREQSMSAEKAINKSEERNSDQLKLNNATFTESLKSIQTTVDDLKSQVGEMRANRQGGAEHRSSQRSDVGMVVGIIGALMAVLMFMFNFGKFGS